MATRLFLREEHPVPTVSGAVGRLSTTAGAVPFTKTMGPWPSNDGDFYYSDGSQPYNANWETGDWTVQLHFPVPNSGMSFRPFFRRVSSTGALLEAQTPILSQPATGTITFGPLNYSWSPGNLGDRILVILELLISTGTAGLELDGVTTWVDTPITFNTRSDAVCDEGLHAIDAVEDEALHLLPAVSDRRLLLLAAVEDQGLFAVPAVRDEGLLVDVC